MKKVIYLVCCLLVSEIVTATPAVQREQVIESATTGITRSEFTSQMFNLRLFRNVGNSRCDPITTDTASLSYTNTSTNEKNKHHVVAKPASYATHTPPEVPPTGRIINKSEDTPPPSEPVVVTTVPDTTSGDEVVVTEEESDSDSGEVTSIPISEASTIALFAIGLLGMWIFRRRK